MPNASDEPISMFHQSDVMPCAARLCGDNASCFEPQADATRTSGRSATSRARRNLSPDLSPWSGYPAPAA